MTMYAVEIIPLSEKHDAGAGPGKPYRVGGPPMTRHEAERVERGVLMRVDRSRFCVGVVAVRADGVPGADEEE